MKKIISLLVIPSVITLATTTIGITANQIINSIQQNQVPKLLNPPTQNISQTFRTKQIYINANDAKEIPLLEYVEDKNSLLPFLKGSQDTIELDLNVWKPLGMEDEIFLRNLKFNLSNGYFQTSYLNSISQSKLIKYNVKPTNYPNNSLFPSVQNKENYDNLLPKKTNDQTYWDEKLVFNFHENNNNGKYNKYRENNYAFIVFDIKHERSEEQHKPNSVNRLLIRPMLRYNLDTSSKTITIPSQNMKISLISEFLNFNPLARISVDSYLSDSQKLNLYSGSLGKVENYISFDTEKGDNELILSSSSKPGHKIPTLEIDTSNMYLDKDINHINTKYQVDIEGLKIKNAKFKIRTSSGGSVNNFDIIQNDENDENNLKYGYQNLDISFDISESDFPNASSEKVFHFPIFRQSYINDLPSYGGNPEAKLSLEIKVKPKVDQATKEKIPFQYEVSEIKFLANSYNNVNPTLEIDVEFKVMQSQIYVKTKPKNFSFSRMQNQLIKPQRNEFVIDGQNQPYNYSSNVFDDTYFVDQMTNKIKNNYEISYDHTNNKFKETILQSQDFLNFGVDTTNPLDLFNLPFTKIKYTGKEEEFRQRGQMEFSYSTVNTNKFFKNINFIQRIKYELRDNQKEMVDISINHDNLNNYANKVSDINVLVSNLNNLNLEQKFKLINISNKDDDKKPYSIVKDIEFSAVNKNIVDIKVNLFSLYLVLYNENLLSSITLHSQRLNINTFNPTKVNLEIDSNKVIKAAKEVSNYEEFKRVYQNQIREFIKIDNIDWIKDISFIDEQGFNHKVSIKVVLVGGLIFHNDTNEQIVSVSNINWKGQSNQAQGIQVNIDFAKLATIFQEYENAQDLLNKLNSPNLIELKKIFIFDRKVSIDGKPLNEQTTINDLHSIRFEKVQSSFRKIKVILKAKEWRYFDYPGSNENNGTKEFVISNVIWKNEEASSLIKTNVEIDMPLLYQSMFNYFKNKDKTLSDFVQDQYNKFIDFGKNATSFIKLKPYDVLALNAPIINVTKNGIKVLLELNEGFYVNKTNNFAQDRFNSQYEKLITIEEIKNFHQEYIKPNPQNELSVELNYKKIEKEAREYKNMEEFLLFKNNDFSISEYIVLKNKDDLKKIKNFEMKRLSDSSLEISVEIFSQYFFSDLNPGIKVKKFEKVHNLIFKDQEKEFKPVIVNVNRKEIINEARKYENRDRMILAYENKTTYEEYKHLLLVNEKYVEAIEKVNLTYGKGLNDIQIIIQLKDGFYFDSKPISQAIGKINISNLLFKNDPQPEEIYDQVNFSFNGNIFLDKAKEFNNLNDFMEFLYKEEKEKWKPFLNLNILNKETKEYIKDENLDAILRIQVFTRTTKNQISLRIILNDNYYFENENYTINYKDIVVGNLFFKEDGYVELKQLDLKFNERKFYELVKDYKDKTLEEFILDNKKYLINFKYEYNGILWINTNDDKSLSSLYVQSDEENNLKIILETKNGYFFNQNDRSNIRYEKVYSEEKLINFANNGLNQIRDEKFQQQLMIILGVSIPFVVVAIVIVIGIILDKRQRRKLREE